MKFLKVDLENKEHCRNLISLLNEYMKDPMGNGEQLDFLLENRIIAGLKEHPAYLGFFVLDNNQFVALANCNLVFSTWKAKKIINIHDLIVHPLFRRKGIARFLLGQIRIYANEIDCCKINLEVREDNFKAQNLYKSIGFNECKPINYFWEMDI